jgi:hypothetical protein
MCLLSVITFFVFVSNLIFGQSGALNDSVSAGLNGGFKVPLDLFVMSRCPDAVRCELRMNDVIKAVPNITKVQTHYIADVSSQGLQCKHGFSECLGNQQQLCVLKYVTPQAYWGFIQCQDEDVNLIGTTSLAEKCLGRVLTGSSPGSVAHKVRACFNSKEGERLLQESALFTKQKGIQKSCTMWLNGKPRCVHDGGIWYDCPGGPEVQDFIDSICSSYWRETGHWAKDCEDKSLKSSVAEML